MIELSSSHREELIGFCQALVRTPSVNGVHGEEAVANLIAEFALSHGLNAEVLGLEAERPCTLVRVGPDGDAGLLLVGHTDTVAVGNEDAWDYPPFGAEIVDGRLYGRGAADTKGGIVAAMSALLMLQENAPDKLRRPVLLACVPDEESGATGRLGIRYLHGIGKLSGHGAIYAYPGVQRIKVGHRGVLRLRIVTRGKSFHTGSAWWQNEDKSYNAVTGMAELLLELEQLELPEKSSSDLFERLFTVITPTVIQGGTGPSITPDYCEAIVDIRLVPSYPREEVEGLVNGVVACIREKRTKLQVEITTDTYLPPTVVSPDTKIVSVLSDSIRKVLGEEPMIIVSGPANESYLLNSLGIPTCCLGPNGRGVHSENEHVFVDSIFQAAAIYALTALEM